MSRPRSSYSKTVSRSYKGKLHDQHGFYTLYLRGSRKLGELILPWAGRGAPQGTAAHYADPLRVVGEAFYYRRLVNLRYALAALDDIQRLLEDMPRLGLGKPQWMRKQMRALSLIRSKLLVTIHRAYCNRHADCKYDSRRSEAENLMHMELARQCAYERGFFT